MAGEIPIKQPFPNFFENWVETVSIVVLIVAFILFLIVGTSAVMNYIISFLCGLVFGRLWYKYRHHMKEKWGMMIIFFAIGIFLAASITGYGIRLIIIVVYLVGIIASYMIHERGLIRSAQY